MEALGIAVAARVPVLLWGAPGTGKTSVIRAMAAAAALAVRDRDRVDPRAVGLRRAAGRRRRADSGTPQVSFAPPRWAGRARAAGRGGRCSSTRSRPRRRPCRRRCCGSCSSARSATCACPTGSRSSRPPTRPSRPPTAGSSRRRWPTASATSTGRSTRGRSPTASPAAGRRRARRSLADGWERRIPVARSWVAGFVTVRPTLALAVPEDAAGAGRAWPSPRTWDMAARLLAAAEAAGGDDVALAARPRLRRPRARASSSSPGWSRPTCPIPRRCSPTRTPSCCPSAATAPTPRCPRSPPRSRRDPTDGRWERGLAGRSAALRQAAPDVAAAAARTLARCRPDGAPIPDEVQAFRRCCATPGCSAEWRRAPSPARSTSTSSRPLACGRRAQLPVSGERDLRVQRSRRARTRARSPSIAAGSVHADPAVVGRLRRSSSSVG